VRLERLEEGSAWSPVGAARTGEDGRVVDLAQGATLAAGTYRLRFDTAGYLVATNRPVFYPHIDVVFRVEDPADHLHLPLLLSPFGYATYRGS
ncbi:MAG: hydroxyisourate hydrolase, partial [Myxococcales bacterium]|nr:hydroxyisourate hydrolase [Myxococcales bacterium]